jgi:DNA-binding MarR family transcriptional regulator
MASPIFVYNKYKDHKTVMPDPFDLPARVTEETGQTILEQQAHLQLMRTAEVLGAGLGDLLAAHGLSGKQYNILRALRRGGPEGLTVSEIAAQMTDPRADMTRLLDRLERDGRIVRAHDRTDRRIVRSTLTDAGQALLAALDGPVIGEHCRRLGHMTADELRLLAQLLIKARSPKA